jgi:glucosamine--fructose-6-phosphate aminotransferase (isomerizing)
MTTHFEAEIRSQGDKLAARAARGATQAFEAVRDLGAFTHFVVAARGSSDNAALFFQYLAGTELGKVVALATPSLYETGTPIDLSGALIVAISQSGRSPGIAAVAELARAQGRPTIAVTNDEQSPLATVSGHVLSLGTGPEKAIASTKTFSATWHALAQLIGAFRGAPLEGIVDLPIIVERTVTWALSNELAIASLDAPGGMTVVGRGIGFAVADEIALKIREVAGIRAESYAVADFLHGPIGADGEDCALLLVLTDELSDDVAQSTLRGCHEAGMVTVVLRSVNRPSVGGDVEIVVPEATPNWLTGLCHVVIGQVLALRLGERRQRPIDTSPRLKKVTLSA